MQSSGRYLVPLLLFACAGEGQCATEPPSSGYCSILEAMPHNGAGRRDGGVGFSIVVPSQARKTDMVEEESGWSVGWVDGKSRIASHYGVTFNGPSFFGSHVGKQCSMEVNEHRVFVDEDEPGKFSLVVHIEDKSLADPGHWLWLHLKAADKKTLCSLSATTLWSTVFVNDWKKWKLVSVAKNRKTFLYSNEVGEVRKAKLGDGFTRDEGKVTSISSTSVEFTELVPDGSGGWIEKTHVLNLVDPPLTK